jgi:hypothetical protein
MQSNAARAGLLAALAAAAVVLFIVLSGGDDNSGSDVTTTPTAENNLQPVPEPPTARIEIKGDGPVEGIREVNVNKGDRVELVVVSDSAGELHVHGYELEEKLTPGKNVLQFTADIDGKFEIELHAESGAHAQIAELTVQP